MLLPKHTLLLAIVWLLSALSLSAQTDFARVKRFKPNFTEIKTAINDPASKYYYPRLMRQYESNDTLMKLDKFRYLYLGYAFQEDYNPYRSAEPTENGALDLNRVQLTHEECLSVVADAQAALADNPFNLRQMSILISALRQLHRNGDANIWQYKFDYILMAIASTGTGADEENAWYVIEPQHEYMLLNAMGYTIINHLFYEPYFEYLTVADGEGKKAGGYYFNIHHVLEEYYRKFPEEL